MYEEGLFDGVMWEKILLRFFLVLSVASAVRRLIDDAF